MPTQAAKEKNEERLADLFHYCDQCGQKFTAKETLKQHRSSEHENLTYPCPECPETFKTLALRRKHRNIAHSTEDKFLCKECGKRFGDVTGLQNHRKVHAEAQFQCRHCEKRLKSETALLAHERMHTGEKPFACKMCSACFTSSGRLSQHMKGVHQIAGKRGGKTGWWKKEK